MNPYVIPGLEEKRSYIEQSNAQDKIIVPKTPDEVLREVYLTACNYFDVDIKTPLKTRKKEIITVRHWSIFIAKCKGFSNHETTAYFKMNTSMAQYIVNKTISEIEIYDASRTAFDYFIISLGLMMDYKKLYNSNLKKWLNEYYKNMQVQISMMANQPLLHDDEKLKADMRNFLDKIHENRMDIYGKYVSDKKHADKNSDKF